MTRTKALGADRTRKLRDALPGGDQPLRTAVWPFLRPILSPRLTALNRDALVLDSRVESTVDLGIRPSDSDLADFDLGDEAGDAASQDHHRNPPVPPPADASGPLLANGPDAAGPTNNVTAEPRTPRRLARTPAMDGPFLGAPAVSVGDVSG